VYQAPCIISLEPTRTPTGGHIIISIFHFLLFRVRVYSEQPLFPLLHLRPEYRYLNPLLCRCTKAQLLHIRVASCYLDEFRLKFGARVKYRLDSIKNNPSRESELVRKLCSKRKKTKIHQQDYFC
jgi:hypothetical protein